MDAFLTVDAFLEQEMLNEDHMDVMLDEVDAESLHYMIDESITDNLFFDPEDLEGEDE